MATRKEKADSEKSFNVPAVTALSTANSSSSVSSSPMKGDSLKSSSTVTSSIFDSALVSSDSSSEANSAAGAASTLSPSRSRSNNLSPRSALFALESSPKASIAAGPKAVLSSQTSAKSDSTAIGNLSLSSTSSTLPSSSSLRAETSASSSSTARSGNSSAASPSRLFPFSTVPSSRSPSRASTSSTFSTQNSGFSLASKSSSASGSPRTLQSGSVKRSAFGATGLQQVFPALFANSSQYANYSPSKSSLQLSPAHKVDKSPKIVQQLCNKLESPKSQHQFGSPMSQPKSLQSSSKSPGRKNLQSGVNKNIGLGFNTVGPVTNLSENGANDNWEPLNLSKNLESPRKDDKNLTKEPTSLKQSSEKADSGKSYKLKHPIGSRKVTENVITYHETMFQSVANSLFENQQKSQTTFKRKVVEEDKTKGQTASPDSKKAKLSASDSDSATSSPVKGSKRKKPSIENIVERIRTEKTVSRSCNNVSPALVQPKQEVKLETVKEAEIGETNNKFDEMKSNKDQLIDATITSVARAGNETDSVFDENSTKESGQNASKTIKTSIVVAETNVQNVKNLESNVKMDSITIKQEAMNVVKIEENNELLQTEAKRSFSNRAYVKEVKKQSKPKLKPGSNSDTENNGKIVATSSEKKSKKNDSGSEVSKARVSNASNAQNTKMDQTESKEAKPKMKKKKQQMTGQIEYDLEEPHDNVKKKSMGKSKKDGAQGSEKPKKKPGVKKKETETVESEVAEKSDHIKKYKSKGEIVKTKISSNKAAVKNKGNSSDGTKPQKCTKGKAAETKTKHVKKKSGTESDEKDEVKKKCKTDKDNTKLASKSSKAKDKNVDKLSKAKRNKLPIACRRVRREASLNASAFVNILCESQRSPKLEGKRSKSESDLKKSPIKHMLSSSVSVKDLGYVEKVNIAELDTEGLSKIQGISPKSGQSRLGSVSWSVSSNDSFAVPKLGKKVKALKTPSPKRKVSFSEDSIDSVFEAVIQRSIEETENHSENKKRKTSRGCDLSKSSITKSSKENKHKKTNEKMDKSKTKFKSEKKDKKFRLQKIKKAIKLTVSKSPDEIAEKKRKANLARLERAKELLKTKKRVSDDFPSEESSSLSSDSESGSSDSLTDTIEVGTESEMDKDVQSSSSDVLLKVKAKKGALCRAARTHVSVESKTVVDNAMPSPRWCECCQSTYYPSQPTQGAQVWRIKQLVDKGSSKSPEPIQTSSHHFIAAHASCEVRPYASPSHVPMMESNPYVGQIVPHGHIQCSACSCGHSGMFHPNSCQNCTLGGVGNLMSCQRYGNTYSVTYPHSHGSFTHCGCGSCYPASTYHHTVGQTLIHQPQMSMSPDSSILLHHPVQLQVTREAPLPVTMPALTHSISDPSSSLQQHSGTKASEPSHTLSQGVAVQSLGLQFSQGRDQDSLANMSRMCQFSQGELTNVSVLPSNMSSGDNEIVDVGSRDDIVKNFPQSINSDVIKISKKQSNLDSVNVTMQKTSIKDKHKMSQKGETKSKDKKTEKEISNENRLKQLAEKKKLKLQLIKKRGKSLLESKNSASPTKFKAPSPGEKQKTVENHNKADASKQKSESLKLNKTATAKSRSDNTKVKIDLVKSKNEPKKITEGKKLKPKAPKKNKEEKVKSPTGVDAEQKKSVHGWSWDGEGVVKKLTDIFDGKPIQRTCYNGIIHEDGDQLQVKDCVLICSGRKEKDIPYVAKITNFWEDTQSGEMMMSVLWFYRPEHAEGVQRGGTLENEVFAAKHRDETLVACIEDRAYVLTFNEYCRCKAEVERVKSNLPPRKNVVPDSEEVYPSNRIPPVDVDPDNVFLCRQVYDIKLKRVLKNPS